jgi:hypothetical protein
MRTRRRVGACRSDEDAGGVACELELAAAAPAQRPDFGLQVGRIAHLAAFDPLQESLTEFAAMTGLRRRIYLPST